MGKSHWLKMFTMAEGKIKKSKHDYLIKLAKQGDGINLSHIRK
jgi:hypothetical protein